MTNPSEHLTEKLLEWAENVMQSSSKPINWNAILKRARALPADAPEPNESVLGLQRTALQQKLAEIEHLRLQLSSAQIERDRFLACLRLIADANFDTYEETEIIETCHLFRDWAGAAIAEPTPREE